MNSIPTTRDEEMDSPEEIRHKLSGNYNPKAPDPGASMTPEEIDQELKDFRDEWGSNHWFIDVRRIVHSVAQQAVAEERERHAAEKLEWEKANCSLKHAARDARAEERTKSAALRAHCRELCDVYNGTWRQGEFPGPYNWDGNMDKLEGMLDA